MSKRSEPNWILNDDWGVGIDPMNWRVYRRQVNKKTKKRGGWKVVGYYPHLAMLIEGLQRDMLLEDSDSSSLAEHVEDVLQAWHVAVSSLSEQINTMGAELAKMPPAVACQRLAA